MILHLQCFHSCKRTESRIKQGEFFGPYKDSSIITFVVVAFFITFHVILKINRSAYMKTRSDEYFTKRPICTSKIFVVNHCIKKKCRFKSENFTKKVLRYGYFSRNLNTSRANLFDNIFSCLLQEKRK